MTQLRPQPSLEDVRRMIASGELALSMDAISPEEQRERLAGNPDDPRTVIRIDPMPVEAGGRIFVHLPGAFQKYADISPWPPNPQGLERMANSIRRAEQAAGAEFRPIVAVGDAFSVTGSGYLIIPGWEVQFPKMPDAHVEAALRHELGHVLYDTGVSNVLRMRRILKNLKVEGWDAEEIARWQSPEQFAELLVPAERELVKRRQAFDAIHGILSEEPSFLRLDPAEVEALMERGEFQERIGRIPETAIQDLRLLPANTLAREAGLLKRQKTLRADHQEPEAVREIYSRLPARFLEPTPEQTEVARLLQMAIHYCEYRADREAVLTGEPFALAEDFLEKGAEASRTHPSDAQRVQRMAGVAAAVEAQEMALSGAMVDEAYAAGIENARHRLARLQPRAGREGGPAASPITPETLERLGKRQWRERQSGSRADPPATGR